MGYDAVEVDKELNVGGVVIMEHCCMDTDPGATEKRGREYEILFLRWCVFRNVLSILKHRYQIHRSQAYWIEL